MPCKGSWLLLAYLALSVASSEAGVIHGVVRVPATPPPRVALNPYAGSANAVPGAAPPAAGKVADAVVWVEGLSAAAAAALPRSPVVPRLVQEDQTFKPRVLPVAVGTEVDFPNRDAIFHNVFSLSPVQRFDLGKYPRGQTRRVTFRRAGVVPVFCDIHSNMEAFVVVTPNRAFARPNPSGAFTLPALPPGDYALILWHPDHGQSRTPVTVAESSDLHVTLEF